MKKLTLAFFALVSLGLAFYSASEGNVGVGDSLVGAFAVLIGMSAAE